MRTKITHQEFLARLKAQGVPVEHIAFRCPVCGTIQSPQDLIDAGVGKDVHDDAIQRVLGFSCIGRARRHGPFIRGRSHLGIGCDWSLGGLFQLHTLEVEIEGHVRPCFEVASAMEAQRHKHDRTAPRPQPTNATGWVIYQNPSDLPGLYVLRPHATRDGESGPLNVAWIGTTIDEVRRCVPSGLTRFNRDPSDDSVIVETWL